MCVIRNQKMEKITSGLPPFLYLYTHHTYYPPHPQNYSNPNFTHTLSLFPKRSVLLFFYSTIPVSAIIPLSFSLSSLYFTLAPIIISQGFRLFLSYIDRWWCLNFGPFSLGLFNILTCCITGVPCGCSLPIFNWWLKREHNG